MVEDLVKKLLEAGVHFGHQTRRWNPKMKRFIYGQRSGIYIIDLEKTAQCLITARDFARDIALKGGSFLFVGTKKQAKDIIAEEAKKSEMFCVTSRWLGGLLTNFQTIKKSIARLDEIEKMATGEVWGNLKKKETSRLTKEKDKLFRDLGGIRKMKNIPQAVFIVDPKKEAIAVRESLKLGIPMIAIVDTNCNPEVIDFPIPGNDDALKAIRLITSVLVEGIQEGRKEYLGTIEKETEQKDAVSKDAKKEVVKEKKSQSDQKVEEPKKENKSEATESKGEETPSVEATTSVKTAV